MNDRFTRIAKAGGDTITLPDACLGLDITVANRTDSVLSVIVRPYQAIRLKIVPMPEEDNDAGEG